MNTPTLSSSSLPSSPPRLVVMISGNGTNLQAMIDAGWTIVLVVSNKREAYGLTRAHLAHIPTYVSTLDASRREGKTRDMYDVALAQKVKSVNPDGVVLVGFLHILSPLFLNHFPPPFPILNLHPALPGTWTGLHVMEKAWQAGQQGQVDHSGVMVHQVIPEVDLGPPMDFETVPMHPTSQTFEQFQQHMHEAEHRVLLRALHRQFCQLGWHPRLLPSMDVEQK